LVFYYAILCELQPRRIRHPLLCLILIPRGIWNEKISALFCKK
jgi:hypothetical protein